MRAENVTLCYYLHILNVTVKVGADLNIYIYTHTICKVTSHKFTYPIGEMLYNPHKTGVPFAVKVSKGPTNTICEFIIHITTQKLSFPSISVIKLRLCHTGIKFWFGN